ncbi:hypothetical protein C7212DRAFT_196840, partial [Tuber magnatum]
TQFHPNPVSQTFVANWKGGREENYPRIHRIDPKKWKMWKAEPEHDLFLFLSSPGD